MKLFNNKNPETQMELGKAIFNLANLIAVIVFFSQITKSDEINYNMLLGGGISLVILYLLALEMISSGEELKDQKAKEEDLEDLNIGGY